MIFPNLTSAQLSQHPFPKDAVNASQHGTGRVGGRQTCGMDSAYYDDCMAVTRVWTNSPRCGSASGPEAAAGSAWQIVRPHATLRDLVMRRADSRHASIRPGCSV